MKLAITLLIGLLTLNADAGITVTGCGSQTEKDIRNTLNDIRSDFTDFKNSVENDSGLNMNNAYWDLFSDVTIECTNSGNCTDSRVAGWTIPAIRTVHLCKENYIKDLKNNFAGANDRRTCFANLISHEMSHIAFSIERDADELGDAAAQWWLDNHNTNEVTRVSDCGLVNE